MQQDPATNALFIATNRFDLDNSHYLLKIDPTKNPPQQDWFTYMINSATDENLKSVAIASTSNYVFAVGATTVVKGGVSYKVSIIMKYDKTSGKQVIGRSSLNGNPSLDK